jgi:hypothetical protein
MSRYGRRMRRPLLGLLACVVAATVTHATPAVAESGHSSKKKGDAPAAIDITAIYANNAEKRVKVKLVVPGLSHKGTFTISYESDRYDGMAIIVRGGEKGVTWQAWHCTEDSCGKVKCTGAKIRWNASDNYIRASVPQSCYPLKIPTAWNFNGHSDLGQAYDSAYTRLRLRRG